jgi:hypothetical protein
MNPPKHPTEKQIQDAHLRRIQARIPLYAAAIGALRAASIRGEDLRLFGVDLPWPKEFAPLTLDEKRTVLARALEQYAKEAAA